MIDATTVLVVRLRELDARAANGALPGTPRKWCAILDDPNEPPGIYTEGYSIIRDDAREADHDDLRLIAEMRNALPKLLDVVEKQERMIEALEALGTLNDHLRKDAVLRCESAIEMHQKAAVRVAELEGEKTAASHWREVSEACLVTNERLTAERDEARVALQRAGVRVSALEDTIDLERAKAALRTPSLGHPSPLDSQATIAEIDRVALAVSAVLSVEARRGAGWKGAR